MLQTFVLEELIEKYAKPFQSIDDLIPILEKASKSKYILLGESSHGTSEFYTMRAEISKWLIENKGFQFLAVEGDWPSCYEANRYIKSYTSEDRLETVLKAFTRWPRWMWANEEIASLLQWLSSFNTNRKNSQRIGFYGIDVYSLWESMEAVIRHLEKVNSPIVEKAKKAFSCFEPFHRDPQLYGVSAALYGKDCMQELMDLLQGMHRNRSVYNSDLECSLNLKVNALVTKNAEYYYHTMVTNDNESWNIRDRHMVEALSHISNYYGSDSKGIIWAHNTHIGDARATDMANDGMVNIGQLIREEHGNENVYAIGFGTYKGTVIAADKWEGTMRKMNVPPAEQHSWEEQLHRAGEYNKYLMFDDKNREFFKETIGHRAIGVVYNPEYEYLGNYVPSNISDRYDAYIHFEETNALRPLRF